MSSARIAAAPAPTRAAATRKGLQRAEVKRRVAGVLAVVCVVVFVPGTASADPIGFLSLNSGTLAGTTFNITNLTGDNAFPPYFPITTPLTIGVIRLTAETVSGQLTVDGSAFTLAASGDVNCTLMGDASTGGCNFGAYEILSATLTGTLSPTTGVHGLPPGYTAILSTFTVTMVPEWDSYLTADVDLAYIEATPSAVPEPTTGILLGIGAIGLLARGRLRRRSSSPAAAAEVQTPVSSRESERGLAPSE